MQSLFLIELLIITRLCLSVVCRVAGSWFVALASFNSWHSLYLECWNSKPEPQIQLCVFPWFFFFFLNPNFSHLLTGLFIYLCECTCVASVWAHLWRSEDNPRKSSYLLCGFWGLNSWEACRHVSLLVELSFWNLVYKPGWLQTKESHCLCLPSAGWD